MEFRISRYDEDDSKEVLSNDKQVDLFQARIEQRRQKRSLQKNIVNDLACHEKENVTESRTEDINGNAEAAHIKKKKKKTKKVKVKDGQKTDSVNENGIAANIEVNMDVSPENGFLEMDKRRRQSKNCSDEIEDTLHDDSDDDNKVEEKKKKDVKKKKKRKISEKVDKIDDDDDINSDDNLAKSNDFERIEVPNEEKAEDCSNEKNNNDCIEEKPAECNSEFFPILGKQKREKKALVKRTLPRWLSEPTLMSPDIDSSKVAVKSVDFLSQTTVNNLNSNGIDYLFPVQSNVIEKVIHQNCKESSRYPPSDICVQAPTGSGKTLAYTLAIVDILSKFIVKQLYCLIVLPSKDLALQVKRVVDSYVVGTNLKVALASGVKSFSKEQEKLVINGEGSYFSAVDILVCTPGRLVDHLKETPGFTLRHLRFLVVDEADRLLGQNYSSWLEEVKASVYSSDSHSVRRRKLIPLNASTFSRCQLPFQKLLFSATLTQNPEKIAPLELYNPILFTTKKDHENEEDHVAENDMDETDGERYIIPEKLVEKMVVVEDDEKPLVLIHLMVTMNWKGVLCFTKSIESTHRLTLLLQKFGGFTVAEFSSGLSETQRKGIIRDFNNGKIDLLISSDAMARGMDIEKVKLVVNYDTARNAKTYVHRVGRTARAGKKGFAITILCGKEVYHFKLMMKKLSGKVIPKMNVAKTSLHSFKEQYEAALFGLQEMILVEKRTVSKGAFVKRT